jgi:hypothetical protein
MDTGHALLRGQQFPAEVIQLVSCMDIMQEFLIRRYRQYSIKRPVKRAAFELVFCI